MRRVGADCDQRRDAAQVPGLEPGAARGPRAPARAAAGPAVSAGLVLAICNQQIVYDPVDEFLKAREAVRQSNKEKGIESSPVIDDLIMYFLPSHMWMGKLMSESKGAVNKIQDRMMVEYDHEYR